MIRIPAKLATLLTAVWLAMLAPAHAGDAAFTSFVQSLWPDAQKLGVSRATFDAAVRDLEPDLSLPDLVIPGRTQPPPGQPEFVQTPADYLKESSFDRLAARGRSGDRGGGRGPRRRGRPGPALGAGGRQGTGRHAPARRGALVR